MQRYRGFTAILTYRDELLIDDDMSEEEQKGKALLIAKGVAKYLNLSGIYSIEVDDIKLDTAIYFLPIDDDNFSVTLLKDDPHIVIDGIENQIEDMDSADVIDIIDAIYTNELNRKQKGDKIK